MVVVVVVVGTSQPGLFCPFVQQYCPIEMLNVKVSLKV